MERMDPAEFGRLLRGLDLLLDRLYHWARRANDETLGPSDGVAKYMLELSSDELHRFVTTLLDCFRPIAFTPSPVAVGDLVARIVEHARVDARAASVTVTGDAAATVTVDPGQLERAWPGIVRRLGLQAVGRAVRVTVRAVAERVEVALRLGEGVQPSGAHEPTVEVEWTLARRIVHLHGGEVREDTVGHVITVTFPVDVPDAGA
jgi:hypothetical protein